MAAWRRALMSHAVWYEGMLKKGNSMLTWTDRYFVVKAHCLAYYDHEHSAIPIVVVMFTRPVHVEQQSATDFTVSTSDRVLKLRTTKSEYDTLEWVSAINKQILACRPLPWHPRSARGNNEAAYFVDGKDTFEAVACAIEGAQHELLMCGTKFSLDVLMRFDGYRRHTTLFQLLCNAARRRVQIFLLENENSGIEEILCREGLQAMFHIISQPKLVGGGSRDRIVIADRVVALLGSTDLSFGHWYSNKCAFVVLCSPSNRLPWKDSATYDIPVQGYGRP
jgi:hypothetical protein